MRLLTLWLLVAIVANAAAQPMDKIYVMSDKSSDAVLNCPLPSVQSGDIIWLNNNFQISPSTKFVFGTNNSQSGMPNNMDNAMMTIKNVVLEDGGRYICQRKSDNSYQNFILIVFEPVKITVDPNQMIKVGDPIRINCSVTYSTEAQLILPDVKRLRFTVNVGSQEVHTDQLETLDTATIRNKWTSFNTTASNNMKANNIMCKVQTNDLTYSQSGHIKANIPYAPTADHITIPNIQPMYQVNDKINCSVDGNPLPSVSWNTNTSQMGCTNNPWTGQTGAGYAILQLTCMGPQTWTCMSRYQGPDVSAPAMVNKTFTFDVRDSNNASVVAPVGQDTSPKIDKVGIGVGIGVGLGLPILIGLILLICCLSRRKKKKVPTATLR